MKVKEAVGADEGVEAMEQDEEGTEVDVINSPSARAQE